MILEYGADLRIKDVTAVLDEYSSWFMQLARGLSYPNHVREGYNAAVPKSYERWAAEAKQAGLAPELIAKLDSLHSDLSTVSAYMLEEALKHKKPPEYEAHSHLVLIYEGFINHIRRIEKDIYLEDSGIDQLTGLRNISAFKKDFGREMERLARHGRQFCVALVRIDDLAKIKKAHDEQHVLEYVRFVSNIIKQCVRTFDDAYRMDNNEFVLFLKLTDITGSLKAMDRLKGEMEAQETTYKLNGQSVDLTLSSCIAAPIQGDDVQKILNNLQEDLGKCATQKGAVFEYYEMSPLQRYVSGDAE